MLTTLAMMAFAGNSLLCRAALKHTQIDAASFTSIRLISGALMLWLVVKIKNGKAAGSGNWPSALALFIYAAGFSFAYVSLPTATGALLLFGSVIGREAEHYSSLPVRRQSSENAMVSDQHASSSREAKYSLGNVRRQSPRHCKGRRDNQLRRLFSLPF